MDIKQRTLIVTDSCCDLPPELITKHHITILPLTVSLSEETFKDGIDINPQKIYEYYNKFHILPKTAAPSVYDFTEVFQKLTSDGYEVFFIGIGDQFSSTYSNAYIAAKEFEHVCTADSGNLSSGLGLLVLMAAELAEQNLSSEEIASQVAVSAEYVDASFVIEKLEYLYKGGRCSAVQMLSANALKIKPCIEVREGKMGVGRKYRGNLKRCITSYIEDSLSDSTQVNPKRCFITHTINDREIVESAIETVKKCFDFEEIIESNAGSTIASHCGEGTLGILFFRNHIVNSLTEI